MVTNPIFVLALHLITILWNPNSLSWNQSIDCWVECGEERIKMLDDHHNIELLKSGNPEERMCAAARLAEARVRAAVPALIEALDDKNQYVRSWAAGALGQIGDSRALQPLIKALEKYLKISETDILDQESKCVTDIYLALESITGKKFGMDVQKWKEYAKMKGKK